MPRKRLDFKSHLKMPIRETQLLGFRDCGNSNGRRLFFGDTRVDRPCGMGDGLPDRLLAFVDEVHDLTRQFLKPKNANGGVADFHALWHSFITMLASSGVRPKVTQVLARHSMITLTMDRYSHAQWVDLNSAVENLLSLTLPHGPTSRQAASLIAHRIAVFGDVSCELVTTADETSLPQHRSNERPQRTREALKIRASANGCGPAMTGDKPLSALGLEPRTYGLKVRCSTN